MLNFISLFMNQVFKYFLFIFWLTCFSSTFAQVEKKSIKVKKNDLWETKLFLDKETETYQPPIDPDVKLSSTPVEPLNESKVVNKTVQPLNPYKSKIDIDYLIKNRLPFFTNPSPAFVKSNSASYSNEFEGTVNLIPAENLIFKGTSRVNRFKNYHYIHYND